MNAANKALLRSQLTIDNTYTNHRQIFTLGGVSRYGVVTSNGSKIKVAFAAFEVMNQSQKLIKLPAVTVEL